MLSIQARELFDEIRRANSAGGDDFDLETERHNSSQAGILTGEPANVNVEERTIAGLRALVLRPALENPGRKLIFLHGGAFALMSPETHSRFAGHIAKACRAEVFVPDYSLAPECPYPRALDECVDFVQSFTESAQYADCQIVLSGDSAGGGLALSAAMKMRDAGRKLPACLVLLCPWLDLALKSESISRNRENAIILKRSNLEAFARLYVDDEAAWSHPYVSPVYGDLRGLPPIYIQGAELDLLIDDAARLQQRARADGTPLRYDLFPQMPHSFQFFAGAIPEADAAISQIGHYLDLTFGA